VFSIYVVSADTLSADTDEITADTMEVTADANNDRRPFITNYPPNGDIGTYRHDNFFAYQFEALDLDNEPIAWEIVAGDSSDIPPGLFFNQDNGWLTGYLPNQGATEITYSFSIFVRAANPPYTEGFSYDYTMTVIGDIADAVTWISPQQLGTIKTGSPSLFAIEAVAEGGQILQFRLKPGSYPDIPGVYNKLPQGLKLLPSGSISGRVSFNGFSLDEGTTTFDEQLQTRLEINPTTFDSTFNFTVNAYSADGLISVNRTFTIVVDRDSYAPYENIYIEAMPVQADRSLVQSLVQNRDIFPPSSIYRNEDPYFGVQQSVKYIHTFGLATATLEEYLVALEENHFRKRLVLGEIKTAQALDSSGNVEYEVVYSEIVDTGVNQDGESPGQTVNVAYPFTYNGETISKVYPNSLINMRDRVVDTIGSESNYLPLWMTSKQSDGRVLGFTKAWVIAYTKPGESARIAYNVRTEFGEILNRVDWIADRYILDKELTKNWVVNPDSTDGGSWLPASETTFDFDEAYGPDSTNLEASTTFDGDSLRFISPVDQWSFTDEYNKYLVFPKTNILG
jgi:hypothetical protein